MTRAAGPYRMPDRPTPADPRAAPMNDQFSPLWPVYAKAVEHDYFAHRGAGRVLHRVLADEVGRPFRFLDLACGDARTAVAALRGTAVAHYRGVDLSAPALAAAAEAVRDLPCPAELVQADMAAAVAGLAGAADVAWVGLSLHHLPTPDKLALLRGLRAAVGDGGRLLAYEPVSAEGEGRAAYLDRFERTYRPVMAALTDDEWAALSAHVRAADFPETAGGWAGLGRAAGFADVREPFTDPLGMIGLFQFRP